MEKMNKKKDNVNGYMSEYMKKQYVDNPEYFRMCKNTLNAKKKYHVREEDIIKYRHYLHSIIKIKELINGLPSEVFENFLSEYQTLDFPLKS
tara:strand:- start:981 stop:1256 length:276 start_codon:yes stop_codon:yes gene_type:complete